MSITPKTRALKKAKYYTDGAESPRQLFVLFEHEDGTVNLGTEDGTLVVRHCPAVPQQRGGYCLPEGPATKAQTELREEGAAAAHALTNRDTVDSNRPAGVAANSVDALRPGAPVTVASRGTSEAETAQSHLGVRGDESDGPAKTQHLAKSGDSESPAKSSAKNSGDSESGAKSAAKSGETGSAKTHSAKGH